MTDRITDPRPETRGLTVAIDGTDRFFTWLWLRDHSQDPEVFHQAARQRLLETFDLGEVPAADAVTVENSDQLVVRWDGQPESRFTAEYLAQVRAPEALYDAIGHDRVPWTAETAPDLCASVEHDAFVEDDAVLARMLDNIRRYGMIQVKNVPLDGTAASRRVMERIAYIRSSIFGEMWELNSDGKLADTGSTPLEIKPHTDGTYNHDAPGLMSLHCLKYEATGGDNTLVDGFNIAAIIRETRPEIYETLSTIPVPGQYIGDGAYLVAQRPVFRHDSEGRLMQVSFNNHDRAPFHLPEPQMSQLYEALGVFDHLIQQRENQFAFGQRPGDMVIFDNWRLMHGRLAFEGQRHMVGAYLNREDFESRMRMLAPTPMDMVE